MYCSCKVQAMYVRYSHSLKERKEMTFTYQNSQEYKHVTSNCWEVKFLHIINKEQPGLILFRVDHIGCFFLF